jgi:hypothetical protein
MPRKPLGPDQAMLESICVDIWLGMLFGSLAEPDQEAFNRAGARCWPSN